MFEVREVKSRYLPTLTLVVDTLVVVTTLTEVEGLTHGPWGLGISAHIWLLLANPYRRIVGYSHTVLLLIVVFLGVHGHYGGLSEHRLELIDICESFFEVTLQLLFLLDESGDRCGLDIECLEVNLLFRLEQLL